MISKEKISLKLENSIFFTKIRFLDFIQYENNKYEDEIADKLYYYRTPITLMTDNQKFRRVLHYWKSKKYYFIKEFNKKE